MRTLTATAVLSGMLALGASAVAPASAASIPPAPTRTPSATASSPGASVSSGPACPLDAKTAAKGAAVIAEIVVRHPAVKAADGTTTLAVRIEDVLKGEAKKAPATVVVTGAGCAATIVGEARSGDILLILGTAHGTQLRVSGAMPTVLVGDQACQIERVLGKACEEASTGVVFTDLSAPAPKKWLRIAAPGLAAIIVSVLGLFLLRLRRR